MRNFKYSTVLMALVLFSCSSQKTFQTQIPFELGSASCQEYYGGREESGRGTSLSIPLNMQMETDVELVAIFFRGKEASVIVEEIDGVRYARAKFPNAKEKSPEAADLNLELAEAVLSYKEDGKLKYTKIKGIKQKQPLIHNSIPKN